MGKSMTRWNVPRKQDNIHYKTCIPAVTNTPGAGTNGALGAVATAGEAGTYDVSVKKDLTIYLSFDADEETPTFMPILVEDVGSTAVDAEAATAAEAAAAINAVPLAAKFLTASNSSGSLRLTTKVKGAVIGMYVGGEANDIFAFVEVDDETMEVGVGEASTVEVTVNDLNGDYIPYAELSVTLYAASSGSTKDATATVQHSTVNSSIIAGEFTNTATVRTNMYGVATFEVIDSATGNTDTHADVVVNSSLKSTGRTAVTTGTAG